MTTLNTTSERNYTIEQVGEIIELARAHSGLIDGYTPLLKGKTGAAKSSIDHLKEYSDKLRGYEEIPGFREKARSIDELIRGLELRTIEIQGENLKANEAKS